MKSLLLFSIGPVQDFIAASRRMRDLSNGSHMLSFLISRAVNVVRKNCGDESLIFPVIRSGGLADLEKDSPKLDSMKIAAIPNRILAVVDTSSIQDLTRKMEEAVRGELIAISEFMIAKAPDSFNTVDLTAWREVIQHSLEITWATCPVSESELKRSDSYIEAYKNVSRLLGMRKTLRDFPQMNGTGYVCSLSPNLSAVKPLNDNNLYPSENRKFTENLNKGLDKHFHGAFNNEYERLAPLSYLKRIYDSYLRLNYGLSLGGFESPKEIANNNSNGKEKKYYSILLMDGDRMGARLTNPKPTESEVGVDYHKGISENLHKFATQTVPDLVKDYNGQLIYAGGDDVLAMFPTDQVVGCADAIRKAFSNQLPGATMSAGITVVHVSHPLREALDDARIAEKRSKNILGRSAISFRIVKRSGQILVSGGKWESDNKPLIEGFLSPLFEHVRFIEDQQRKGISYKWVQDLTNLSFVSEVLPTEATVAELYRLFSRHAQDSSKAAWSYILQPWIQSHLPENLNHATTMIDTAFYLARGTDQ